jgi:spore coat protein A, manganese oxidase
MIKTGRLLTRKDILKLGALGGAAFFLPLGRTAETKEYESDLPGFVPYQARLRVPPVLEPVRTTETTDYYEITMKQAMAEIVPGYQTPIWGYNGLYPGPTISTREDRRTVIRQINELPVPTSIHHHGAYVDGDSDGHPLDLIPPGGWKDYSFNNQQCARTQWYHDHAMHITATNVYRGLAGMYIIKDDFEDRLPLPKDEYEVPLVIQDRLFNSDGSFSYPADAVRNEGFLADIPVVNGVAQPRFEVANRRYRFRVLNGSNARPYNLALSSGRPFTVIASEGGLFVNPVRNVTVLPIAPAERYEIVVDFSDYAVGERVVLENRRVEGDEATRELMRFDVVRAETDDSEVPDVLVPEERQYDDTHLPPDPDNIARRREFRFDKDGPMFTINGLTFDGARIDANPREGDTEIWTVYNNSGGWIHPVHLHLVNFKVLSRNGNDPNPWERGWKDTVLVGEGEEVRIMMRWPKVPVEDEPGPFAQKYVFHCHNLEHEDHDMMAQIGVRQNEFALPEVTATPQPGTYHDDLEVTLTSTDPNARVFYTTDGSIPLPSSPVYTEPIEVDESVTIRAMAADRIGLRGPVSTSAYVIEERVAGTTAISLNPRRRTLRRGQRITFSGTLTSKGLGLAGQRVELESRPAGGRRFERIRRAETRENGSFSFARLRPARTTTYRVVFDGDGSDYEASVSPASIVGVRNPVRNRR